MLAAEGTDGFRDEKPIYRVIPGLNSIAIRLSYPYTPYNI